MGRIRGREKSAYHHNGDRPREREVWRRTSEIKGSNDWEKKGESDLDRE